MIGTFHHIGIACGDLDTLTREYLQLGYQIEGPDFEDPIQQVRGRFLVGTGPRLELLVAREGAKVLEPWLGSGPRMYHLAYEVTDIAAAETELTNAGGRTVVKPVPAVAFGGRQIAFVMLRSMQLIELIAT